MASNTSKTKIKRLQKNKNGGKKRKRRLQHGTTKSPAMLFKDFN